MNTIGFNIYTVPEMPNFIYNIPMATQIQWAAENRINRYYPEYKRLDILASGNEQEITKMNNFLAAINNWVSSGNPTASSLKLIIP